MYDMKNLTKLKTLGKLVPNAFKAFLAFDKAVFQDGAISVKDKELIAVAVAVTTQSPYCIEDHAERARKAGASDEELAEATMVAAAMRAGGGVAHATHVV